MTLIRMNGDLIRQIDAILERRGISRTKASKGAGLSESYIRDLATAKGAPNLGKLQQLADYLEIAIDDLLTKSNVDGPAKPSVAFLPVVGTIAAGQFRDTTMLSQDHTYPEIAVAPVDRFSHEIQYALKVEGDSMNLKFPDGCFVTCVQLIPSGLHLKNGMTVHVERYLGGGQFVETTLKEYQAEGGRAGLYPRSSNPVHVPIFMNGGDDTEVQIVGVVTGSWKPELF